MEYQVRLLHHVALITGKLRPLADLAGLLEESAAATVSLPTLTATLARVGV